MGKDKEQTVQEKLDELKRRIDIGKSDIQSQLHFLTIYKKIQSFAEAGFVKRVEQGKFSTTSEEFELAAEAFKELETIINDTRENIADCSETIDSYAIDVEKLERQLRDEKQTT